MPQDRSPHAAAHANHIIRQQVSGAFRKRSPAADGNSKETLTTTLDPVALADRIRALAMQNDPDALRAGLSAIAAELDTQGGAQ